jgi:hypothetical protein
VSQPMMIVLIVIGIVIVCQLGFIFAQLRENWRRLMTINYQLEELGAPLKVEKGMLVAKRTINGRQI